MLWRAQIINSLLLSKLIYIASMFPVPEEVIKEANRIIFKFLWKGQDRVARNLHLQTVLIKAGPGVTI